MSFARVSALLMVTMIALMIAHNVEIAVWGAFYAWNGVETAKASPFEFAFENYTALGYGDELPAHRVPADRPDHRAQWPAADRLVGRHHLRGHEDGRGADRRERIVS